MARGTCDPSNTTCQLSWKLSYLFMSGYSLHYCIVFIVYVFVHAFLLHLKLLENNGTY